jgi:hypothetical protein
MARHIVVLLLVLSPTPRANHPAFQIQRAVHIFNFCIALAVHVADPQGLEASKFGSVEPSSSWGFAYATEDTNALGAQRLESVRPCAPRQ